MFRNFEFLNLDQQTTEYGRFFECTLVLDSTVLANVYCCLMVNSLNAEISYTTVIRPELSNPTRRYR